MSKTMTIVREITLVEMKCGQCDLSFAVPDYWKQQRVEKGDTFYCPNGHPRVFRDSDNDRLRKELERAKAQATHARDQAEAAERSNTALRGVVTKKTREAARVANGVCPCCNRTFQNLGRHMKGQHPDFDPAS